MNVDLNPPGAVIEARKRRLLAWYDRQGRDLPWRRESSLYGTWVAETMLQQTTVATVAGRWQAFMDRFPDVHALAGAAESEVLAAWSGLGYYRRARSLHQAARRVVSEHGGRLPADPDRWRALPGVGEYTAAAVASIGLGLPVPVVDVNVRRVLLRWSCADGRLARTMTYSRLRDLAAMHLDRQRPADWNQAMMDLGAGPCRVGIADCGRCPVRRWCAAGPAGTAAQVAPAARRSAVVRVQLSVLVLRHEDRVLWLPSDRAIVARAGGLGRPRRDSLEGLLTGMWSLPMTPWYAESRHPEPRPLLRAWLRWLRAIGWPSPDVAEAGWHKHAITRHRLRVLTVLARWPEESAIPSVPRAAWSTLDRSPPLPSLMRPSLAALEAPGWAGPPDDDL